MTAVQDRASGVDRALAWCEGVIKGDVLANRYIRLACERHQNDLIRAAKDDDAFPYVFDAEKAERAIRFIELLPHTKGRWAAKKKLIVLEGWQCFFVAMIFGWVHRETGYRRFRVADLLVPRKNGKSILAAAIGLYMLTADGETGGEIYAGATTEKQAWEVFKPASIMVTRTRALRQYYRVQVFARKIERADGSVFAPVIGKPGDGASPSCGIVDEYHEHESDVLYDTFETGMGARDQPLMLVITTAGADIAGPCYAHFEELKQILEGLVVDHEVFGLIFTLDDGDDWRSVEALQKANPNFDVSVNADFLIPQQKKAIRNARHQNKFKTKHLNLWVSAMNAYFNLDLWGACARPDLEIEADDECFAGVDLSSKKDVTAYVRVFRREINGQHHYFVKSPRLYLPETVTNDEEKKHYHVWVDGGFITTTPGPIIDYATIRRDVVSDHADHAVDLLGYDPWGATQFAQDLQDDPGIETARFDMKTQNLSEPTKWLDALMLDGRIHHDGNPVLAWMIANVVAREDANDNVFPRKPSPEKKIDGAIALIIALGLAMSGDKPKPSYLETDDLVVL